MTLENTQLKDEASLETEQELCHRIKRLRKESDKSLSDSYHRDTTLRFEKLERFSQKKIENVQRQKEYSEIEESMKCQKKVIQKKQNHIDILTLENASVKKKLWKQEDSNKYQDFENMERQKAPEVEESMKCQEKVIQEQQKHIDILILENASVKKKLWKQEDSNKYQGFENMVLAHEVSRLRKRLECEMYSIVGKLNQEVQKGIDNLKSETETVKEELSEQENLIENEKFENTELKHEVYLLKDIFENKIVLLLEKLKEEKQIQIDNLKLENALMKNKLLKQNHLIMSHDFENTELKNEVSVLKERLELSKIVIEGKLKSGKMAEKENLKVQGTLLTSTLNGSVVSDDSDEARSFDSNETMKPASEIIQKLSLKNSFQNHTSYIHALSHFEKLGTKYLISGSWDKNVKIWNLSDSENATLSTTLPTSAYVFSSTIFEHDSSQFFANAGCDPNEIQVRDLEDNSLYCTLAGHSRCIHALANYEIDKKTFLVSGSVDETIKIWDIISKECIHTFIGHFGSIFSLDVYEKDGKKLLVSGSYDKTVKLWDLDCKSLVTTFIGHSSWVFSVIVFYKGNVPYLASGSHDQTIKIWNLNNHQLESTLTGHTHTIMTLALIPTENRLYLVSGSADKTIKLWDLEKFSLRKTLSVPSIPYSLTSYSTNIPRLISGHKDGSMMFWTEKEF